MKYCECGCGKIVKKGNRFINGHNSRGNNNPMKRKEISQKVANKLRGKKISKDQKEKIKNTLNKFYSTEKGKKNIENNRLKHLGKKQSEIHIQRKIKANTGTKRTERQRKTMSEAIKIACNKPEFKRKMRKAAIKRIEANNGYTPSYNKRTIPILQEFKKINNLKNCYFATEPNEWHVKGTTYSLDFIDFDYKLIIEIDEYYHENEIQKAKDIVREDKIKKLYPDFKFLRFKDTKMKEILEVKV